MGEQASIAIKNQLYKDNMTTQGLALFKSNVYLKQTAHIVLTLLNMLLPLKSEARGKGVGVEHCYAVVNGIYKYSKRSKYCLSSRSNPKVFNSTTCFPVQSV